MSHWYESVGHKNLTWYSFEETLGFSYPNYPVRLTVKYEINTILRQCINSIKTF